ncbi:hypothetical protein [Haliangium sp. UPWRP_2]|uniref:hypothetical protein n=1 Tax=Haliangium sp. UPWRP_2 TaxID=1931276 RepID=UPI000D0D8C86|nr:hypothetical protein [Haliangium sp. UPWRP_2]
MPPKKKPVPVSVSGSTAPHDSLTENRRLPVISAASIPKVPAGFAPTPNDERARRLTRPAEALRAEVIAALGEVIGRKATYRSELGDVPPELALAEILHPRLLALHDSREAAEALVSYLRELEEIAYSDAADFLQAVDDEVIHRSRKNSELTSAYARVLLLSQARSQAVSEGIARARRDQRDPVPGEQPGTPQPG